MNNKARSILKNFSYSIISNLVSLITASLVILVIPKLIGVEEYGYWQLYLFYSTYVGFMHFGWNDGVYLRYGGKTYGELNKPLFFSQFWMLVQTQFIFFSIIFLFSFFLIEGQDRIFIIHMTLICMVIVNIRRFLFYILQATNKIKTYARITVLDRFLYIGLIILFLLFDIREYNLLIVADLIGKFVSLAWAAFYCKDIVFRKFSHFKINFTEAILNIRVGINIMLANIASILIIGIVRFGIERSWNVATFGKVSLILSISNLLMIFINAIGIVVFPVLKRTDENRFPAIYIMIRNMLMVLLFGLLILNYPIKYLLSIWLPEFVDSLKYLSIIFPLVMFEGKMVLLINTYLKTLRKEKVILRINLVTLFLSIIFTIFTTEILKNLDLAVLSIVILLFIRAIIAEFFLSKILKLNLFKDILLELFITIIFIFLSWNFNTINALLSYLIFFFFYLYVKRKDLNQTIKDIKKLLRP